VICPNCGHHVDEPWTVSRIAEAAGVTRQAVSIWLIRNGLEPSDETARLYLELREARGAVRA
jgi:transcriptional regulator with XRE-family HTH domain